MSSEMKSAEVRSSFAESNCSSGDKEKQLLREAIRSIPSSAVKELLSAAVCVRCIFRLLGIEQQSFCSSSLSPSLLRSVIDDSACTEPEIEPEICSVCLGVLQLKYRDEKEMLVRKENASDMARSIAELVKREGYEIDSFSLEVSVPQAVLENESAIMSDLRRKYGSEVWYKEKSLLERISVKDALKSAIVKPLEALLDIKCCVSSFRVRLTFTSSRGSKMGESSVRKVQDHKRQKTGSNNETNAINARPSNDMEGRDPSIEKVNEPCYVELLCHRTPIYIGGRYLKYSRNVSQTRWMIDEERMGEASVEEIIGGNILPTFKGDNYKFHAAGREDIDVRMLGSGRPFLVEIHNARQIPSEGILKDIEARINGLENKLVGVKNLKTVGIEGWDMMREGEAEKQKKYVALVWISRPLEDEDIKSVSSFMDMEIMQKTPVRVLHRRSPLERGKVLHWMKIERIAGSSQYFLLHLCTQAGTYIKEFVHGDLGRTHPSIGSILKCRAEILQLDVIDVKMDCFL